MAPDDYANPLRRTAIMVRAARIIRAQEDTRSTNLHIQRIEAMIKRKWFE